MLAAVVALLGAAAAGFAVSELTSDDGDGSGGRGRAAAARRREGEAPSGGVAAAEQSGAEGGPVALAAWPADQSAYTVILVTSSDEAGARRVASEAARSGLEAGLLRSDDYAELGKGFWLVFAGRYPNAATAERRAARLGARFEGASAAGRSDGLRLRRAVAAARRLRGWVGVLFCRRPVTFGGCRSAAAGLGGLGELSVYETVNSPEGPGGPGPRLRRVHHAETRRPEPPHPTPPP